MKRSALTIVFLLIVSTSGWSKFNKEDTAYLEEQFQALKTQIANLQQQNKVLNDQLAAVTKQLVDMQKGVQDTLEETHKDRDSLESLNTSLRLQQIAEEQGTGNQKQLVTLLQDLQQKLSVVLTSAASSPPTVVVPPT